MGIIDNVRVSFQKVKEDMLQLKESFHEWVQYLNGNQQQMQQKIEELEYRIKELEWQNVPEEFRQK